MAREKYLRKFRADPPPPQHAAKYLRLWPDKHLYAQPHQPKFHLLTSALAFGNPADLWLDIGCNAGEFILGQAAANPHHNYIGIDLSEKPLYYAVQQAAQLQLDNVLFIRANLRLLFPLLVPNSLAGAYLLFPPPFSKAAFYHQRMFNRDFLNMLYLTLKPGAELLVLTDDPGYFAQMRKLAAADARFEHPLPNGFEIGIEAVLLTRYQQAKQKLGLPTHRLVLRKPA